MDNQQSNTHSEDLSSPQRCGSSTATNSYIYGDGSGNSGSHNQIFSNNTTNYYYCGATSSRDDAEILQCLYTSAYESHRSRVREPVEGTCTWVTGHPKYKGWLEERTSGLLWLSADPGCGKSVIASFLVTHLKTRQDAIVCYFFFKDDSGEQRSATFALCAILHQLFSRKSSLCKYAKGAFEAKGKRFTEEVDALWKILVEAVAEAGHGEVFCVLDALDECEQETLAQLIRHFTRLPGSRPCDSPLKFIVTSRPYYKIEKELGSPAAMIRLKGEDEVKAITADVTRVIDDGVRELELGWGNSGGLEYLRNLLKSSSDRTFLWVSLVLEVLKNCPDGSREELTNIVSTAPRDLTEFYTKILDKSTNPDKARRILHMVVAAERPLTLEEMNIALTIRRDHKSMRDIRGDLYPGFAKTAKNVCGLFVRIIDSRVYLIHQTAREFLIKGTLPSQGKWQYTLSAVDSSFMLAASCISYLALKDFEGDPIGIHALDTSTCAGWGTGRGYVQKYAFLDYAANNWAGHFRDSQDRQMELFELTRLICKGGSNRFLTWLKVYWENSSRYHPFPNDFTHLMIASWFGQRTVVGRLLEEAQDINARSKYGTALNVAAFRKHEGITRMLLEGNVKAYLGGKECNILHTKRREAGDPVDISHDAGHC